MGYGIHGNLSHDRALDWISLKFKPSADFLQTLEDSFQTILRNPENTSRLQTEGLVAAEFVAFLNGHPSKDFERFSKLGAEQWVIRNQSCLNETLVAKAIEVVEKVAASNSTLRSFLIGLEGERYVSTWDEWQIDLLKRLRAPFLKL